MNGPIEIFFGDDGKIRSLYSDDLPDLLEGLGAFQTRRASHCEPADGGWTADMSPFGGDGAPVLGPFPRRGEAIQEEIEWLRAELERGSHG